MSQPVPSVVARAKRWIKLLTGQSQPPSAHPDDPTNTGYFSNAQDFSVNGGTFINELKGNYINEVVSNKQAVFELLEPYSCLGATKDSSARYPPPRCHPETRLKIRESLMRWLSNEGDDWKMLWVRGSAGTGKSAVAQSFGDACGEKGRHGASYFFSRTTGRNKLETVVPTLVCQLATTIPEFRSLVGRQLTNNPFLLQQSPPVQFRDLILGPFATLQRQRHRQSIVIILDGLDECEGENAQREILTMVADAAQRHPDLPIRWLIFSRPEAHLKNAFLQYSCCGREELTIDAECRDDVERYVKDRLVEIKDAFNDVIPAEWPPQDKLEQLLDAVSGLFVFASTCLNSIADPDEADPPSQLDSLLSYMRLSQSVVSRNPLAALDLLYSRILERIPPAVYETTRQILAYMSHRSTVDRDEGLCSAQALSNFFCLDQPAFYKATRWLHSVMIIPEPKDAANSQLRFYHASFQDFIINANRSGKFAISEQDALKYILPLYIYWLEVHMTNFHSHDDWEFDNNHEHCNFPALTWFSEDQGHSISESIVDLFPFASDAASTVWDSSDQSLLTHLCNLDMRTWMPQGVWIIAFLCRIYPSTSFVRTEPSNPIDHRLLAYFNRVIGNGKAKPAKLPLSQEWSNDVWFRDYFIIGYDVKSVIVWQTASPYSSEDGFHSLRSDKEPSEAQISKYRKFLENIKWDEDKVELDEEGA